MKRLNIIKFLDENSRFPDIKPLLKIANSVKIELINIDTVSYNYQYSIVLELKSNILIVDVIKVANCHIDNRIQANIKSDGEIFNCILDKIGMTNEK